MGKITKTMLGLNIVAGIAGIVFGMGVKGDLKDAETAKNNAVASAEDVKKGTSGLESANTKLQGELGLIKGEIESLSNRLVVASSDLGDAQKQEAEAAAALKVAQTDAAQLQSQLSVAEGLGLENTSLKSQIKDYQALGTVEEVRQWKKKVESKPNNGGSKGAGNGGGKNGNDGGGKNGNGGGAGNGNTASKAQVGSIASHDPKFGFYIINRGADHGVKAGDEFNVLRAGNLVGKIKIKQTQPTVSIADAVKAFTRQQLQPGDKVVKSQ